MASDKTSSSSIPFRSKKNLHLNSKSLLSDQQSLSSTTPEKQAQLPSRTRNRKVALSLEEVRRAAVSIHESKTQLPSDRTDVSQSVRRQIDMRPHGNSSGRSKAVIDGTEKIPEKFEILCEFFDSLDCAMKLLRLKGVASNFSNICPKIECLADRRFSYGHLAQLKFILPEAIEFKKILLFDERISCMKPDLHISLNVSMLDDQGKKKTGSQSLHLRKLFRTRLSEVLNSHPEIDEVPKASLPEPFNRSSQDSFLRSSSLSAVKISIEQPAISSTNVVEGLLPYHSEESEDLLRNAAPNSITNVTGPSKQMKLIGASHLSKSFSRPFFQKFVKREAEETCQAPNPAQSSHSDAKTSSKTEFCDALSSMASSPIKLTTNLTGDSTNGDEPSSAKTNDCDSTPAKLVSTPVRLMSTTPVMPPPKRSSMSLDDDSTCSTNKLVRRPPRSRTLKFDDDTLDVLPQSLVQSIREKERKTKEEQMPAISEAKRRQKMIARLPKLFNAIFFLFHKRIVITKEGLIYKLIAGDSSIVDRREVEEQLDLMMELVPEWISEKLTSSGDLLLCIDKLCSAEMVRARLEGAK